MGSVILMLSLRWAKHCIWLRKEARSEARNLRNLRNLKLCLADGDMEDFAIFSNRKRMWTQQASSQVWLGAPNFGWRSNPRCGRVSMQFRSQLRRALWQGLQWMAPGQLWNPINFRKIDKPANMRKRTLFGTCSLSVMLQYLAMPCYATAMPCYARSAWG